MSVLTIGVHWASRVGTEGWGLWGSSQGAANLPQPSAGFPSSLWILLTLQHHGHVDPVHFPWPRLGPTPPCSPWHHKHGPHPQRDGTEGNEKLGTWDSGRSLIGSFLKKEFFQMKEINRSTLRKTLTSLMIWLHTHNTHTNFLPGRGSKWMWVRRGAEIIIQLWSKLLVIVFPLKMISNQWVLPQSTEE